MQAISVVIKPAAFRAKGDLACRTPMQHLPTEFPSVRAAAGARQLASSCSCA